MEEEGAHEEHEEHEEHEHSGEGDTLDIRIAAIFVILVVGFMGGLVPMLVKVFRYENSFASRLLRAFAGGVMLALALVHVVPEGTGMMNELPLPINGGGAHGGHAEEGDVHRKLLGAAQRWLLEGVTEEAAVHEEHAGEEEAGGGGHDHPFPIGGITVLFGVLLMAVIETASVAYYGSEGPPTPIASLHNGDGVSKDSDFGGHPVKEGPVPAPREGSAAHACSHVHSLTRMQHAELGATPLSLRDRVAAHMFELGCVVHSFLLGLTLGVNKGDRKEAVALLVAISFHQAIEAVALGCVFSRARFSLKRSLSYLAVYALTVPVAIAVGIGIADSYKSESVAANAVQGTLDCISGGILLYASLVQLIARDQIVVPGEALSTSQRVDVMGRYTAIVLGAAAMSVLAIWA